MEKKKLHRIVGILIIVAVVIIILPLLTGKNEISSNKVLSVEPPPFPADPASNENTSVKTQAAEVKTGSPDSVMPTENQIKTSNNDMKISNDNATTFNDYTAESNETSSPSANSDLSSNPNTDVTGNNSETKNIKETKNVNAVKNVKLDGMKPIASLTKTPASSQLAANVIKSTTTDIIKSKKGINSNKVVWAIQMGNFHEHLNAIRLANRLRAAGYKAFTRQFVARSGAISTRVYIGPEAEQASARKLFNTMHNALKLEGLIVPFEPLSL